MAKIPPAKPETPAEKLSRMLGWAPKVAKRFLAKCNDAEKKSLAAVATGDELFFWLGDVADKKPEKPKKPETPKKPEAQ